ncbi:MAG: GNAT family N-acetyltransferase [Flavobacteriia bacterium]|nr:GNAT family N-acetyltransferase [Flavobacteriia bacterium]
MSFITNNCTFRVLNKILITQCEPFACSENDLNEFFLKDCVAYSKDLFGKTYCFTLDKNPKKIVCAFTISNDSIKAKLLPKVSQNKLNRKINNQKRSLKSYPAVLIGRLGVNTNFEGNGIGQELMNFVKAWFIDEENKTGCRFLVVDSYNKERPISYYSKNGFKFIFDSEEEEKEYSGIISDDPLNTRLMYFDLILLATGN